MGNIPGQKIPMLQSVAAIAVQNSLTEQIIQHWQPLKDLKKKSAGARLWGGCRATPPSH